LVSSILVTISKRERLISFTTKCTKTKKILKVFMFELIDMKKLRVDIAAQPPPSEEKIIKKVRRLNQYTKIVWVMKLRKM
jgi:hypothetical protein